MKKIIIFIIIFLFSLIFLLYQIFFNINNIPRGVKIDSYESPSSKYIVNIYLFNGGATVDNAIRGELVDKSKNNKKNIYWAYNESDAKVIWIDDETVMINNIKLNVTRDKYDWRY